MITNLFSIFDPTNYLINISWIIPILVVFIPQFILESNNNTIINNIINSLNTEFYSITYSNLSNNLLIPLFIVILMLNIASLIPSSFAITSQISAIIPITFPLWLSSIAYFITNHTNNFLSHLVPSGSPNPLIPVIVIIELTSNLIRPITLSVRLIANITAGHLLIHLLSSFSCSIIPSPSIIFLFPIILILNTLELGVALIQSYILCTLISLYSSEIS